MTEKMYPVAERSESKDEALTRFLCPVCRKRIKALPDLTGRHLPCPNCATRLIVPGTPTVVPVQPVPLNPATPAPATAPEPTVPLHLTIPKTGMSVGTKVSQETANTVAKTAIGGVLMAAGVALAAFLFGVRPPRGS